MTQALGTYVVGETWDILIWQEKSVLRGFFLGKKNDPSLGTKALNKEARDYLQQRQKNYTNELRIPLASYTCVLLCIAQVFYEVGTRTGHYINNTSGACYFFTMTKMQF